jgi:formate dehydrogenase maturation protein FdhE
VSSPATPRGPVEAAFERRAARAEALAGASSAAEEPLRFAAGLYRAQGLLASAIERVHADRPLSGRSREDVERVLGAGSEVLRFAAEHGPPVLAEQARARGGEDRSVGRDRLLTWWDGDRSSREDYLSRALLRPYVEVLARLAVTPDRLHRAGHCPVCGGAPWIAARRTESDGDGARRSLGCALCGGEWNISRIRCPCCAEEDPARLPSFQSDTYPTARIEACETCHRYVKSLDLTVDARAMPEVDDLLSIGMDLWAGREGFTRIEPGLAGV